MTDMIVTPRWLDDLAEDPANSKTHTDAQIEAIAASMREFGAVWPILIDERDMIIAGHARKAAARLVGIDPYPTITKRGLTPDQRRALVIADNRLAEVGAGWNIDVLRAELSALEAHGFDLALTGFGSLGDLDSLGTLAPISGLPSGVQSGGAGQRNPTAGNLAERFGIPPFSVLNAREGWWQDRKRAWIGLGIKSELGRGEGATFGEAEQITEPGLNHYRNRHAAEARAFNDGAVKGKGGLADQVAAKATARNRKKAGAEHG